MHENLPSMQRVKVIVYYQWEVCLREPAGVGRGAVKGTATLIATDLYPYTKALYTFSYSLVKACLIWAQILFIIFLPINLNMYFGYSK